MLRRVLRLARMQIWQICSNRPRKKVPQSARLSAGGGGAIAIWAFGIFFVGASLSVINIQINSLEMKYKIKRGLVEHGPS